MPYNIKQLWEKSVSIDFFIADPTKVATPGILNPQPFN